MTAHAFVDSGERRAARDGRLLKICGECGKARIGSGHTLPVDPPIFVEPTPVREIRMLALALDAVIALPLDVAGWRVNLRANDLRSALGIPRDDEPANIAVPPRAMPDMPRMREHTSPVRARARTATKSIANDQMRAVATRAVENGWRLAKTGGGHMRLEKEGKSLIFSATTSDHRAWRNFKALAKRHGINVDDI